VLDGRIQYKEEELEDRKKGRPKEEIWDYDEFGM